MTNFPRLVALLLSLAPLVASAAAPKAVRPVPGALGRLVRAPIAVQAGRVVTPLSPANLSAPTLIPLLGREAPAPAAVAAAPVLAGHAVAVVPSVSPLFVEEGASALAQLQAAAAQGRRQSNGKRGPNEGPTVVNDEGVQIRGRAAVYYQEVRRMVAEYKGKINLEESLDVMDDSYGDVWAKLSAIDAVARARSVESANVHLPETLMWVDGVVKDGAKTIAVHAHRAYFHKGPKQSEVSEGIRRLGGYLKEVEKHFAKGGLAERQLGRLDEVELVFDTRGYDEIKQFLKKRAVEISARSKGRIKFKYLDEVVPAIPTKVADVRAQLNQLGAKHRGSKGLSKIYEGVIYSRYVGLLLELKTVEHYHKLGYTILQSGRELFDEQGIYVTELDVVVRSPEGKILLVEAKSARVPLPNDDVLRDKVQRKLETYQEHRRALEKMIGGRIDGVVFAMDLGSNLGLEPFLDGKKAELLRDYGFPTEFLYLQSGPADEAQAGRGRDRRR